MRNGGECQGQAAGAVSDRLVNRDTLLELVLLGPFALPVRITPKSAPLPSPRMQEDEDEDEDEDEAGPHPLCPQHCLLLPAVVE